MKESTTANVQDFSFKALLYGLTGKGKTSTVKTLKPETTLVISAESGLLPLAGMNYTVWEMETFADLLEAYKRLLAPEMQAKYKCIFVDSLTEINELAKEQIVKFDRPNLKGSDIGKVYEDLMTMQDYGLLSTRMTRMIRAFRDLPYHIIFTCLESQTKDERTGEVFITPSINGKLALNVGGYFDEVFRMVTKEDGDKLDYYFVTGAVENAIGKDRSGALNLYEPASWAGVFKKIFAKYKIKEAK
jgi:phage nucleotide-binding protein